MVDVGANVDCDPRMLSQFAVMGDIYSRDHLSHEEPESRAALHRRRRAQGQRTDQGRTPLLKTLPLNFIGNVEGRDLFTGKADVVVCDGFIGNVALKVSEGIVDIIKQMLQESLKATITRQIGLRAVRSAFKDFKKRVDYSEFGGAPLLGVKGVCIICHGRSNANAIKNAIRVATEFAGGQVNRRIEEGLNFHSAAQGTLNAMNRLLAASLISAALLTAQSRNPVQWTVETQGTVRPPRRIQAVHGAGLAHLRCHHRRRSHPNHHQNGGHQGRNRRPTFRTKANLDLNFNLNVEAFEGSSSWPSSVYRKICPKVRSKSQQY